jgi:hypothetical protein
MLRNWFKSKGSIRVVQVRNATADLERFVLALKGMSDQEIGTVVAIAAAVRMELRRMDMFPDEALGVGVPLPDAKQDFIRRNLSGLAVDWQKKNHPNTAGAIVWAHTMRAYHFPEVRLLGRQMWGELERGFPHAVAAFGSMQAITGQAPPVGSLQASQFIPVGLEPLNTAS